MTQRNPYLCIVIISVLGAVAILGVAGGILCSIYGTTLPEFVPYAVASCVGALSSFLVMPPRGSAGAGDAGQQEQGGKP